MLSLVFTSFLTAEILLNNEISATSCVYLDIPTDRTAVDLCSDSTATGTGVYIDGAGAANLANVRFNSCYCNVTSQNIMIFISTPGHAGCGSRFELHPLDESLPSTFYGCTVEGGTYKYKYDIFSVQFTKINNPWSHEFCLGFVPDSSDQSGAATVTVKCFSNSNTMEPITDEITTTTQAAMRTSTPTTHTTHAIRTTQTAVSTLMSTTDAISTTQTTERTSSDERPMSTLPPRSTPATTSKQPEKIVDNGASIVPIAAGAGAGALAVIIIVVVSSVLLCRSKKRKKPHEELKDNHVDVGMIDVDMVENALYISSNIDENEAAGINSSENIRHIKVDGGDMYALPSKQNISS